MISLAFLFYAFLGWLVYYVYRFYKNVARYPKGPRPLPFIGNLHQIKARSIHKQIPELAQKYGNVFTIWIPVPFVILADFEATKDAFVNKGDDFAGRPSVVLSKDFQYCDNAGVIMSTGESWRENRRHAISILRDFGMGKGLMEEQVKSSLTEYLHFLDNLENKYSVNMRWPIQLMVANIINETLFGFRYKYDDCQPLINYVEAFASLVQKLSTSLIRFMAIRFPWMKHVPYLKWHVVDKYREPIRQIQQYIRDNVARALESYTAEGEAECFVHAYTQRLESSEYLTQPQLLATCSDFFLAGQETTTTTLRWAVLLMAAHQDVQDKLRVEILSVVGHERLPSMGDRSLLPYTTACVHEIQRKANILQMNVIHCTLKDSEVLGHSIPAGTYVNGSLHTIHAHDPVFEDPEAFRPARYLSEDGKTLNKDVVERTIPFSIGRRQCAGEGLARVELFLGLAATVQRFRILPTDNGPIDLEPVQAAVLLPPEQNVRLIPVQRT